METAIAPHGVEPVGMFAEELATFEEYGRQSGAELADFAYIMQMQRKKCRFPANFPFKCAAFCVNGKLHHFSLRRTIPCFFTNMAKIFCRCETCADASRALF